MDFPLFLQTGNLSDFLTHDIFLSLNYPTTIKRRRIETITSELSLLQANYYGLNNDSNYCFANALIQCLASLDCFDTVSNDGFSKDFKSKESFFKILSNLKQGLEVVSLFELFTNIKDDLTFVQTYFPTKYLDYGGQAHQLSLVSGVTKKVEQNDADEFCRFLLNFFDLKLPFEFEFRKTNYCNYSNFVNVIEEEKLDNFNLNIYTQMFDQSWCQTIEEKIAFTTHNDNLPCVGYDIKKVQQLPDRETIHTFKENGVRVQKKIFSKQFGKDHNENHTLIYSCVYPDKIKVLFFNITRYIADKRLDNIFLFPDTFTLPKEKYKFKLKGVACQNGGYTGGHYIAYCYRRGNWYKFDDSRVTEIPSFDVVLNLAKNCCTQLFYERL